MTEAAKNPSYAEFVASALAAREEVAKNGLVFEAADVHRWLLARAEGATAPRPVLRKLKE